MRHEALVGAAAVVLLLATGTRVRIRRLRGQFVRVPEKTTLTVYAAASLTSSFEEIGKQFEADHEG